MQTSGIAKVTQTRSSNVISIAVFNNKGGVGKSTLTFHLGSALADLGKKTLLLDLDPQSNLTLFGLQPEQLDALWSAEESFINDFEKARASSTEGALNSLCQGARSVHFHLKGGFPSTCTKRLSRVDGATPIGEILWLSEPLLGCASCARSLARYMATITSL